MTVEWLNSALDQLALIWVVITPEERDVIERTVLSINARLAAGPLFLGESRRPGERVWFHHPLVVRFHLLPGGLVTVSHVAKLRPWRADGVT